MFTKQITAITILLLASLFSFSQVADTTFNKQWKEIDSLINQQNLPQSALQKVNGLYEVAAQKKLAAQQIKCLVYRINLEASTTEDDPSKSIGLLDSVLHKTTDVAVQCLLEGLIAFEYKNYFNNNRWRFYNRSNTINFKKEDINTWTADDFNAAISQHYLLSLQAPGVLQQTSLLAFDAIITKGNTRELRPTLFDLLAHEALDYFKSGEAYVTKPTYAFVLDDSKTLLPSADFSKAVFSSLDSASHQLISLHLFQQLIAFHQSKNNIPALIDVDLERVEWVKQNSVFTDKDALYKNALEAITAQYPQQNETLQAWYLLAKIETDKASSYKPFGDTTNRYGYVKAKMMIERVLTYAVGESEGEVNLRNSLTTIQAKDLQLNIEQVNVLHKPFRALVTFKNVDTLYNKIIKITNAEEMGDNRPYDDSFWIKMNTRTVARSFNQWLPQTNDYQLHKTEIKIDALPNGAYALVSSSGRAFDCKVDKLTITYFYVSNISYIKGDNNNYYLLDRETGEPLNHAKVVVLTEKTNDTVSIIKTNNEGHFRLKIKDDEKDVYVKFIYNKDTLQLERYEHLTEIDKDKEHDYEDEKAYFFTDRSIYRPGQTVYFKAITLGVTEKNKNYLYLSKDSITVYLKDVNSKKIDSVKCKQNEFASITGKFILPQNVLSGSFHIDTKELNGSSYVSVEEYKRPTFQVTIDKPKGSYRLNDTIRITGSARAFAGNIIDNSKLVFTVKRRARFLYGYYGSVNRGGMAIADSTIQTDAAGKFTFNFIASPDRSIDKSNNPTFDYEVSVNVTDKGGETRKANCKISVSYQALQLIMDAPSIGVADSLKSIGISTKNMAGRKEAAIVKLKMIALQSPDKIIRKRLWNRPDLFVMSKQEYEHSFPTDDYDDDGNILNWKHKEVLFDTSINTALQNEYGIKEKIKPGCYRIEARVKDKYGEELTVVNHVQLFGGNELSYPQNDFAYALKNNVQPGETAQFLVGSSYKQVTVLQRIVRLKGEDDYSFSSFKEIKRLQGAQNLNYLVSEKDRGGISIQEMFIKDNRVYKHPFYISVPFSNKKLDLNYASFRNKTEPGSKEQWTISVKDSKEGKVAAEVLATMYDASLDQFNEHSFSIPKVWKDNRIKKMWEEGFGFTNISSSENTIAYIQSQYSKEYEKIAKTSGTPLSLYKSMSVGDALQGRLAGVSINDHIVIGYRAAAKVSVGSVANISIRGTSSTNSSNTPLYVIDGVISDVEISNLSPADILSVNVLKEASATTIYGSRGANGVVIITTKKGNQNQPPIIPRTNFKETAFFFPELHADTAGNYTFSFTMPDALTEWKWLSFAHTKDLQFGTQSASIVSQKTLMVQSNAPRFMREGDKLDFSTKISNLSNKELTGQVSLELVDALTEKPVDGLFQNVFPSQYFTVAAGQSTAIKFPINIPYNYNKPLLWKVVARAGNYSDGEEKIIPVVTNRQLVTESMPIMVKGDTTVHLTFDKLLSGNNGSESLSHESVTVECTPNPVWYAVQGLPYLMEYPYECAEQTFNRFYANALAAFIVAKHPRIKAVFAEWMKDSSSLKSNLYKNQELKQILLEETPWVLDAQNETKQQHNIALLFDVVKMANSTASAIDKLKGMQSANGGFAWFRGGYEDRYITNYILTGIGKLKKAGALTPELNNKLKGLINKALDFMDDKMKEDYQWLLTHKVDMNLLHVGSTQIQYLYMRSFWADNLPSDKVAYNYYYNQGKKYWVKQNLYNQALLGIAFGRNGEADFSLKNILPSITENAIHNNLGMYWKETSTCFWYQNPVEYESAMIAFYNEVLAYKNNRVISQNISDMKTWLILNKQTNNWKTTVATADACYALLMGEDDLLDKNKTMSISLGEVKFSSATEKGAAGTGYFKERIGGDKVKPSMGNITVTTNTYDLNNKPVAKLDGGISYGAVYWQYFEDMDKITSAASPLSIKKKLFIEKNTNKGKVLTPVNENDVLKVGEKVVIRLELRSDRDMEYLHLKDSRAATMEPENVLSSYKWQDGLGYYEATKDASTNFFISYLQKGTYVFEYPVFITHTGNFSTGTANIQCMYAPEFTSHSEGMKVRVEE